MVPPKGNIQRFFNFLSTSEAEKLLTNIEVESDCGKRDKALIELMYLTQARVNEIENIKMFDLGYESKGN
ncbi:MAG: hypothetical protein U5N58_10415 [Actinomycetota bacterium]|nr:hypothetical protein [Actinomycetota bacterium]